MVNFRDKTVILLIAVMGYRTNSLDFALDLFVIELLLLDDKLGSCFFHVVILSFQELDNLSELFDTFLVDSECFQLSLARVDFNKTLGIRSS